MNIEAYPIIR